MTYLLQKTIDFVVEIEQLQSQFLGSKTIEQRKALGQFFTGRLVANYMASLIVPVNKKNIRLLDAGSGLGILTAAAACQCLTLGVQSIHAVLYELDAKAIASLDANMRLVAAECQKADTVFSYEIINEDFILSRPDKNQRSPFDIVLINPPYFKYNAKSSPYAKALADLYKGDPNIYASFIALACACLDKDGQMITITPRSFTNGLYFKGFRTYLLSAVTLDLIHLFKLRDKVFKDKTASVLQENIICRFLKNHHSDEIIIRTSDCNQQMFNAVQSVYDRTLIIDNLSDQQVIRVPESRYEANIMRQAELLDNTFEGSGYFISTGPVVEHRARAYITAGYHKDNKVPLYRPHNIKPLIAAVTYNNKNDVSFLLNDGHEKHTLKNNNYVLLKRLSSKDEKRRLVAGIHFAANAKTEYIGFGNKVNYLGVKNEILSEDEAFGLAALFNSTFLDKYFRCLSGNTQVNATEIRTLKFPPRDQVKLIGQKIKQLNEFGTAHIDKIVNPIIGVSILQ